jgi:uncharacterized protein (TIGR02246 family)
MMLTADERLDILALVARADACATARDADGYAALFTDDAVMSGSMGVAHGSDALRDAVARIWAAEPPDTLHLTTNVVIDESSAEPSILSVMLMLAFRSPPGVVGVAQVRQTARQTPAGWRISSRAITTPTTEPT